MNAIDILVHEHDNILLFIDVIHHACYRIIADKVLQVADFKDMITFARTYADHHHHNKEEQILFKEMLEQLGPVSIHLIQHGMLVEHDLGRFHIGELEKAVLDYEVQPTPSNTLAIIVHAGGWANLLQRHIEKENNVVYPFALRSFPPDALKQIDQAMARYEEQATKENVQENALHILHRLLSIYVKQQVL